MSIFSVFTLLGGLAFFIYGMNQMSHSMEIIAGEDRARHAFESNFRGRIDNDRRLLTSYERISDHCSNIAIAVLEEGTEKFNPHEYMHQVKSGDDPVFQKLFDEYQTNYLAEFSV